VIGHETYTNYPENYPQTVGTILFNTNYFARANIIIRISPESKEKFPDTRLFKTGEFISQQNRDFIKELSYQLIN